MKKKIIIIGGETQTRSLAEALLLKNHYVTVVSSNAILCQRLSEINGLNVILGDGRLTDVLEDADINEYDIAVTMFDHDADNVVTCQLCKKVYGVGKTISLVSDVKRKPLFDAVGVDSVICATDMVATTLEQQTLTEEISRIVPTTDARLRISEIVVRASGIVGKRLMDLHLPSQTIIGCIIRHDEVIIPNGSTVIYAGDNLLLITTAEKENEAVKVLTGR